MLTRIHQLIPKSLREILSAPPFVGLLEFSCLKTLQKKLKSTRRFSILILIVLILGYFIRKNRQRSIIRFCKLNQKNNEILSKLEPILNRWSPSFYLPSAQMMVISQVLKNPSCPPFTKEILRFDDGTEILLEWSVKGEVKEDTPIVAFLLGTVGVPSDPYCRACVKAVTDKGWRLVIIYRIGFGFQKLATRRFLGKNEHENFNLAIPKIQEMFPKAPMFLLGVSNGANQAALYLGHHPITPIKAAVTIGNPYNISRVCYFMSSFYSFLVARGVRELYHFHMKNPVFLSAVSEHYKDLKIVYKKCLNVKNSTWKIEKKLSSKLSEADSVFDYHSSISSETVIDRIRIPLLAINSLEDPVCFKYAIPVEKIIHNENIISLLFERGGHIEYFNGWRSEWFAFEVALEYFDIILKREEQKNESAGDEKVSTQS